MMGVAMGVVRIILPPVIHILPAPNPTSPACFPGRFGLRILERRAAGPHVAASIASMMEVRRLSAGNGNGCTSVASLGCRRVTQGSEVCDISVVFGRLGASSKGNTSDLVRRGMELSCSGRKGQASLNAMPSLNQLHLGLSAFPTTRLPSSPSPTMIAEVSEMIPPRLWRNVSPQSLAGMGWTQRADRSLGLLPVINWKRLPCGPA